MASIASPYRGYFFYHAEMTPEIAVYTRCRFMHTFASMLLTDSTVTTLRATTLVHDLPCPACPLETHNGGSNNSSNSRHNTTIARLCTPADASRKCHVCGGPMRHLRARDAFACAAGEGHCWFASWFPVPYRIARPVWQLDPVLAPAWDERPLRAAFGRGRDLRAGVKRGFDEVGFDEVGSDSDDDPDGECWDESAAADGADEWDGLTPGRKYAKAECRVDPLSWVEIEGRPERIRRNVAGGFAAAAAGRGGEYSSACVAEMERMIEEAAGPNEDEEDEEDEDKAFTVGDLVGLLQCCVL